MILLGAGGVTSTASSVPPEGGSALPLNCPEAVASQHPAVPPLDAAAGVLSPSCCWLLIGPHQWRGEIPAVRVDELRTNAIGSKYRFLENVSGFCWRLA